MKVFAPGNRLVEGVIIDGKGYPFVKPTDFAGVVKGFQLVELIRSRCGSPATPKDEQSQLMESLETQQQHLLSYMRTLGDYDNSTFSANLAFLLKKYGIRIGDLEALLGISPGYISRTTKENAGKRMSIDVIWQIAKLFEVDITTLVEQNMALPVENESLLVGFLSKAYRKTVEGNLQWEIDSDDRSDIHHSYFDNGLITTEEYEDSTEHYYHPDNLNPDIKWLLSEQIFICRRMFKDDDLVIIPFSRENSEDDTTFFDFFRVSGDEMFGQPNNRARAYARLFSTAAIPPYIHLREGATRLFDAITKQVYEVNLTAESRKALLEFLS